MCYNHIICEKRIINNLVTWHYCLKSVPYFTKPSVLKILVAWWLKYKHVAEASHGNLIAWTADLLNHIVGLCLKTQHLTVFVYFDVSAATRISSSSVE